MALTGSSPLARGLLGDPPVEVLAGRIIPARAGFTTPGACSGGSGRDHPRSRGVYIVTGGQRGESYGSSPLARGLHPR